MSAFPSTRWSLVLTAAQGPPTAAHTALATLCQNYWYPLYAYIRRRGFSPHDAEDLTQEFFNRVIEDKLFARADREKGKFRTFLLTCLTRFLAKEHDKTRAEKRGGKSQIVSLNVDAAEHQYQFEPVDTLTPEVLFDRAWALAVLENGRIRLHKEFSEAGKQAVFERLQYVLQGSKDAQGFKGVAEALGKSEAAIKMEAARMRTRYRSLVKAEVIETVADPRDAEQELRYLLQILSGN